MSRGPPPNWAAIHDTVVVLGAAGTKASAGCATVSAMSMARRRRATPQCQPLATNRCLERSSPSPRSV